MVEEDLTLRRRDSVKRDLKRAEVNRVGENGRRSRWMEMTRREGGTD